MLTEDKMLKSISAIAAVIAAVVPAIKGCSSDIDKSSPASPSSNVTVITQPAKTTLTIAQTPAPAPASPPLRCLKDNDGGCRIPRNLDLTVDEPANSTLTRQQKETLSSLKSGLRENVALKNGAEPVSTHLDGTQFFDAIKLNVVLINAHVEKFSGSAGFELMANIESLESVIEWTAYLQSYLPQIEQFVTNDQGLLDSIYKHTTQLDLYMKRYQEARNERP